MNKAKRLNKTQAQYLAGSWVENHLEARLKDWPSKPMLSKVAMTKASPMAKRSPRRTARLDKETCQRESDFRGLGLTAMLESKLNAPSCKSFLQVLGRLGEVPCHCKSHETVRS